MSSKRRRLVRAGIRWGAVVALFATLGAGSAYGVVRLERGDVPGLSTRSDGRWEYPEIRRPVAGADARAFLLPAPTGASGDSALSGWVSTDSFLATYAEPSDRRDARQELVDYGVRHIAARGWTAADGTRTSVYLLRFDVAPFAERVFGDLTAYDSPTYAAQGVGSTAFDDSFPVGPGVQGVRRFVYKEVAPYGDAQVREAYLVAGDIVGVVRQSRKGGVADVPFEQTVMLQSQLLEQ